ncbi:MAG: succinyl-diaminopimelate desuccinylase [Planktomarina sp.]|jgi:succinyl-diaminopimelate desuccinylase|nr:succinyl-diaminopimelate desuccinylase [Planktomarina sp.]MDG2298528.1 succinyl-diaminopimelate desuccinylase [Planktomarina sp.]MDT1986347.1 succinyl-diaminopimelate desuccinylase [Planktomarina sp.]MDT2018218.1 succinyl-diaminopimelate desuccinylase [Planktomarina sp.]MDV3049092.1 succinyl-diaminopimelate desuccinylase [Planktomarina sp.]|tara:strand:+ start:1673 stop:2803 length:1131 start_codon:yes stop_codon:yes gene_type:complete
MIDAADLTADLIKCSTITPNEGGALRLIEKKLSKHGFTCTRVDRGQVSNLFARWGSGNTFGFNGHTDVVPVGDLSLWSVDPFGAEIHNGWMYGRGATDMKSGVAAFVAAAIDFVTSTPPNGSVVLAITGDEEGPAKDGTLALLDWMKANKEVMDVCLVGEPTCPDEMGQMIKIGRRGSLNAHFTVVGVQGHSAYPHRAKNPLPAMARLIDQLSTSELDQGTKHFDASTVAVVNIDTGNPATNVIPAQSSATVNIRFNDAHSGKSITDWLRQHTDDIINTFGVDINTKIHISGESFITPPGTFSNLVARAVQVETNREPVLSTSGGTSDARFVQHHCPVVEFGLVGKTMHQVDERVEIAHIHKLKSIYTRILSDYFT